MTMALYHNNDCLPNCPYMEIVVEWVELPIVCREEGGSEKTLIKKSPRFQGFCCKLSQAHHSPTDPKSLWSIYDSKTNTWIVKRSTTCKQSFNINNQ